MATTIAVVSLVMYAVAGRTSATTGPAPKTPWGEPDLQGIWSRDVDVPLERPAKYANQEFFTDAERAELDRQIADIIGRDSTEGRRARGTERDVNGEFNQAPFTVHLPVGKRTSLIVDPPDGRIPPLTPEAQKARRRLARVPARPPATDGSLQGATARLRRRKVRARVTETKRDASDVRRRHRRGINRADGPEDRGLNERCLGGALPDFGNFIGGFSRIVQARPDLDVLRHRRGARRLSQHPDHDGPASACDHPPVVGDSRGRWEGDTLVVDVTNFSPKSDFQGAHEHLHLVERWTRLDADTIEYVVTIDDPTTWTRPWTVKQELKKQSDAANRIYYEPRCHEGNYGLVALLSGARASEQAFAEGRGPDPATMCTIIVGCGGFVRGGFADQGPDADPFRSPPPVP